ncbi:MAG TPA: RHS repeat-associated core domain-containing protein [Verrucomicrobiae bacterium]|nr:RHS repeat-associated core domain-containing protein [Verrucomicrobiae bacterium]
MGSVKKGDPIDVGSGNVYYHAVDFSMQSENGFSFTRYYNGLAGSNTVASSLGQHWRSTFDRFLRIFSSGGQPVIVTAERPDGKEIRFTLNGSSWVADTDVDYKLTPSGPNWVLTDGNDDEEGYTTSGSVAYLTATQRRSNYRQDIAYSGTLPVSVTDSFGRSMAFTYQGNLLKTVTMPGGLVVAYNFNSSGQSAGVTDRLASVTYSTSPQTSKFYSYANAGLPFALTSVTDENGNFFTGWTYDAQGRGTSSTQANGINFLSIGYNDADGSRLVTNALGLVERYYFSILQGVPKFSSQIRISPVLPSASTLTNIYDANGYPNGVRDWNGNITVSANEARGLPTYILKSATTPDVQTNAISYLSTYHLPVQIADGRKTTTFTYDSEGNVLTRTEADTTSQTVPYLTSGQTRAWSFSYNAYGQVMTATNSRTDVVAVTSFNYETNGNVLAITNALGHVTRFTSYDGRGLPLEMVDPNGVTNRFAYHPRGWLLSRTVLAASGNATNSFSYDPAGQMTAMTLPDGSKLFYQYDIAHRLQSVSNILGESITYTLDLAGNITRQDTRTAGGGLAKTQSHAFDVLSRLLKNMGANGQTNIYGYDGNGNAVSVKDGLNHSTTNGFDGLNRLVTVLDPLNNLVRKGFDVQDNPAFVTDPRLLSTAFIYDGFGRVISEVSPDRGTNLYQWDSAANCVLERDARNVFKARTFDKLDRPLSETYSAYPAENIAYSYDSTAGGNKGIGRLTGFTDESGNTTLIYDERGNVVSTTRTIGGTGYTTAYMYDLADRVTRVTYPSGHVIGYGRDNLGRVTSVTYRPSGAGAVTILATNISYAPFGPMTSLAYGNGLVRTLGYDLDYRLTNIVTGAGSVSNQNLGLAYDAVNNITAIIDRLAPERSQTFAYDENYRLKQAAGVYGATAFGYDGVGNRLSRTAQGSTENYTYATTANRLQTVTKPGNVRSLAYTAAGNTSSDNRGTTTNILFGYGGRNRLVAMTNGGVIASYKYNALGQRVIKIVSGTATHFHYDGNSRLIAESGAGGSLIREYVWLGDMPLAQVEASGTIYYIHPDHLNTPQKMTDAAKNLVWDKEQQAFGEPVPPMLAAVGFNASKKFQLSAHGDPNFSYAIQARTNLVSGLWVSLITNGLPYAFTDALTPVTRFYRASLFSNSTGVTNNLRFPGQYFDAESGLNYNLNRDYDPTIGRYIQNDPIGLVGGISLYGYATGNALNQADSSGLLTIPGYGWVDLGENAVHKYFMRQVETLRNPDCSTAEKTWAAIAGSIAGIWIPENSDKTLGLVTAGLAGTFRAAKDTTQVFWSGGEVARDAAAAWARANGATTLEMTQAGKQLTEATQGLDWITQARPLWVNASAKFAQGATGDVHIFLDLAHGVSQESIWAETELPTLMQNNNVNNFIFHFAAP